jgi:hypothetical protein
MKPKVGHTHNRKETFNTNVSFMVPISTLPYFNYNIPCCESCYGSGTINEQIGTGCRYEPVPCYECNGTGEPQ